METNSKSSPKIFILSLYGDISMGSGVTLEIGGVSHDRSKLETLKVLKDKELNEYFGDDGITEDLLDGVPEYSYHNNDLSGRPTWDIEEIDLL